VNRLEAVQSQLESMYLNLKKNLSEIEDANMAKTITDFTNQQNLYQAALAVGSRILQPSLIDFMR
jgi:flagellar hook-associated protein 3 FlgL